MATNGIDYLKNTNTIFDCIYIDPSRRDDIKGKVFLLKDCLPNVADHLDLLFQKANHILIKTSPLLDIKKTISDLKFVKTVHVVAVKNEVKELLFVLEKGFAGNTKTHTINFKQNATQTYNFIPNKTEISEYSLPKKYLYEPNSAILKAGAFQEVAVHFKLQKLHQHSHLYTSNTLIDFPGRCFKIVEAMPYQKKALKKIFQKKQYNVTTRNFPKTVINIRKELHIKEGGTKYLFFTTNINEQKIVLVCEK